MHDRRRAVFGLCVKVRAVISLREGVKLLLSFGQAEVVVVGYFGVVWRTCSVQVYCYAARICCADDRDAHFVGAMMVHSTTQLAMVRIEGHLIEGVVATVASVRHTEASLPSPVA